MGDTTEGLDAELQQQKHTNAKLLNLLRRMQGALDDPDGRIGPMIDEAERAKQVLDNCQNLIEQKRTGKGT
jgi:hypothetical protein